MPDGELQRNEGAKAVAEHRDVRRQLDCVHDTGDMVGVSPTAFKRRAGGAEAGQVDAGRGRTSFGRIVEYRFLGEERMKEQQRLARAALVVFDLGGTGFD